MSDGTKTAAVTGGSAGDSPQLQIPEAVRDQYPDILDLIIRSESMNPEERQYWIDILPVMTPDQVKQLRDILQNERDQLAAIDAKYAKEMEKIGEKASVQEIAVQRRERSEKRSSSEEAVRTQEQQKAEDILSEID